MGPSAPWPDAARADPVRRGRQPGQQRRPAAQPGRPGGGHRNPRWPIRPGRTSSSVSASPYRSSRRRGRRPPAVATGKETVDHHGGARARQFPSNQPCTRSRRRSWARTGCWSGCWSRLARGHLLVEGVRGSRRRWRSRRWPGRSAAASSGSSSPPTSVPADVVGTRIYKPGEPASSRSRSGRCSPSLRRRRDQPGAGQGAERAAGGDAGSR